MMLLHVLSGSIAMRPISVYVDIVMTSSSATRDYSKLKSWIAIVLHMTRIVAGACFIRCATPHAHDLIDVVYHKIKTNVTVFNLNDEVCKETNHDGLLCGKCKDGFYPLAYSYNHTCIECPGRYGKWWVFIIVAYIPLTIFYMFVLFFQLKPLLLTCMPMCFIVRLYPCQLMLEYCCLVLVLTLMYHMEQKP